MMGGVASSPYRFLKNVYFKYNAQHRALKFLEKEKLPASPHYKIRQNIPEAKLSKEHFKELYEKDQQLNEYLKRVYLTSKNKETNLISSTRPLPVKKEVDDGIVFYEPADPKPDCTTLSSIVKILFHHQGNPNSKLSEIALEYNLQKESVKNILIYYSLFKKENFEFLNAQEVIEEGSKEKETKTVVFESYAKVEEPVKQIEGKK